MTETTPAPVAGLPDLDALTALEQAATPAPWEPHINSLNMAGKHNWTLKTANGRQILWISQGTAEEVELIVAARNLLPKLLSALTATRAELDERRQYEARIWQRIQTWNDDPQTRLEAFAITWERVEAAERERDAARAELEQTRAQRDAANAALKAIDEHVSLMESEIGDHQSYDYNVNDIDEVAANAHQQGCYAEHEKITRELLALLDNDAVRLATGVTCQPGQPWSCGDAHTAGHCVREQAAPAAAPKPDESWRDFTIQTAAIHIDGGFEEVPYVLCRLDEACEESLLAPEDRLLTLGEAVDWAQKHARSPFHAEQEGVAVAGTGQQDTATCSCPSKFNDGGDPTVLVREFAPTYLLGAWREDPNCPIHAAAVPAAADNATIRARCVFCCKANDGRAIQIRNGRFVRHLAGAGGVCSGTDQIAAGLTIEAAGNNADSGSGHDTASPSPGSGTTGDA